MENNIIKQPSREDFIRFIDDQFISCGFLRIQDLEQWSKEVQRNVGGGVMVINGHQQAMPGETHTFVYIASVFGDGSLRDPETDIEREFLQIDFDMTDNGEPQDLGPELCFFYDDRIEFEEFLSKYFNV